MKNIIYIIITISGLLTAINAQGITNTLGGVTSSDKFTLENNSGTAILTATGEGKVGIGVENPMRILDVDGSITLRTGTQSNSGLWLTNTSDVEDWFVGTTNIAGTNQAGIWNDSWRLVVEDNGNIGIGTSTPSEKLTVKVGGTTWGSPHFALEASGSTNKWDFTVGNSDRLYIGYNESSKVVVQTDGKVGIGTTSPNADLHIEGDIKIGENGSVFQEIRHLQGNVALSYYTHINLPTGFTDVNTRVLSLEVKFDDSYWVGGDGVGGTGEGIGVGYQIEGTELRIRVNASDSRWTEIPYRVVLMRF